MAAVTAPFFSQPSLVVNELAKGTFLERFISYCATSKGITHLSNLLEKVFRVASLSFRSVERSFSLYCDRLAIKFSGVWSVARMFHLPQALSEAKVAVLSYFGSGAKVGVTVRKTAETVQKVADVVALGGVYADVLTQSKTKVSDVSGLVSDFVSLQIAAQDWRLAKKHAGEMERGGLKHVHPEVYNYYVDTQGSNFIKIAKTVCALAATILGFCFTALGGPVVPALAILTFGLAGSFFDVVSDLFDLSRAHKEAKTQTTLKALHVD